MIQVELTIDELDYSSLLERFLPAMTEKLRESGNPVGMLLSSGLPVSMAKRIVEGLPKNTKEQLTADLLNSYEGKLRDLLEQFAKEQGISVQVGGIHAEARSGD